MDLVESLSAAPSEPVKPQPSSAPLRLADYCGFFELDEAREARERLREKEIRSEIVIRDAPASEGTDSIEEEYWLRVDATRMAESIAALGFEATAGDEGDAAAATGDGAGFDCGECGHSVREEDTACPGCGARFDE